jgi:hypothetical protein
MLEPYRTALARSDGRGGNGGDKILIFAGLGVKVIISLRG